MRPQRPSVVPRTVPRGHPRSATAGILLVLGGVIFAALLAQGSIMLQFLNQKVGTAPGGTAPTATATPTGLQPVGTPAANFVKYRDNDQRFALFVSSSWQAQPATVTFNGQTQAATAFAPATATLPQWRIALLTSTIADNQYLATVGAAISAEGGTNFTPTNGPVAMSAGKYQWSRIDATVQIKGATVHVTAYYQPHGSGSLLSITEALSLNYGVTEQQNFAPMLASLNFG